MPLSDPQFGQLAEEINHPGFSPTGEETDSGFSVDVTRSVASGDAGDMIRAKDSYLVGKARGASSRVISKPANPEEIKAYAEENAERLSHDSIYLGGWGPRSARPPELDVTEGHSPRNSVNLNIARAKAGILGEDEVGEVDENGALVATHKPLYLEAFFFR